jgi:hypothetical protein
MVVGGGAAEGRQAVDLRMGWSGRGESNPHRELGKLTRAVRDGPSGSDAPPLTCDNAPF